MLNYFYTICVRGRFLQSDFIVVVLLSLKSVRLENLSHEGIATKNYSVTFQFFPVIIPHFLLPPSLHHLYPSL